MSNVETVEEFLKRGGTIEVCPQVPTPEVTQVSETRSNFLGIVGRLPTADQQEGGDLE